MTIEVWQKDSRQFKRLSALSFNVFLKEFNSNSFSDIDLYSSSHWLIDEYKSSRFQVYFLSTWFRFKIIFSLFIINLRIFFDIVIIS